MSDSGPLVLDREPRLVLGASMNAELVFVVPGEPIAKGRPRFSTRGGFARSFTPKRTRDFESHVSAVALDAMSKLGLEPLKGVCRLTVICYFACPKSAKKHERAVARLKATRPDSDNLGKAVADALNEIVFEDDSQAAIEHFEKWIAKEGDEPRVEVRVDSLDGEWNQRKETETKNA